MDAVVIDILEALRAGGTLDAAQLDRIMRKHSKRAGDGRRRIAKKHVLAYYLDVKAHNSKRFESWDASEELDRLFVETLKMKPRRTASGVATITVITKPWPCSSSCAFCPNDIRMPKSYLHDEPACQRAERNFFDPYLQVRSRLNALEHMGHDTDKIELIVLGGTWTDYPQGYRTWFVRELFAALNDPAGKREAKAAALEAEYGRLGITGDPERLARKTADAQALISQHALSFNEAFAKFYGNDAGWQQAALWQEANVDELLAAQVANESAAHRVVGLVVETRPDALTPAELASLRQLGCTKIQMGVQSLDDALLASNGRACSVDTIARAFDLCRLFGFKTHVHFMLNLVGATPESDMAQYRTLVTDLRFQPDEVKLYPCALVAGTKLQQLHEQGLWRPYDERELVELLCADLAATPAFTRISRMVRDISASDILAGNKKTNLRQIVEQAAFACKAEINEIRFREVGAQPIAFDELSLEELSYETASTTEHFLQWTTPLGRVAGFLRLSLPHAGTLDALGSKRPVDEGEAMIREVHIYGFAARLSDSGDAPQHHGLGRALVERACDLARTAGYKHVNVISAVGTRGYYRRLGFRDNGLYQQRDLENGS